MRITTTLAITFLLLGCALFGCDHGAGADAGPGSMDLDGAAHDAAADAALVEDAGSDAGGAMCREDIRAPFVGRPCSQTTADCAAACDTRICAQECFIADADPQCIQCWDSNQLACWNRNGCQPLWNCATQCIQDNCPTPTNECIDANCDAEDAAYGACLDMHYATCLERTVDCLPE